MRLFLPLMLLAAILAAVIWWPTTPGSQAKPTPQASAKTEDSPISPAPNIGHADNSSSPQRRAEEAWHIHLATGKEFELLVVNQNGEAQLLASKNGEVTLALSCNLLGIAATAKNAWSTWLPFPPEIAESKSHDIRLELEIPAAFLKVEAFPEGNAEVQTASIVLQAGEDHLLGRYALQAKKNWSHGLGQLSAAQLPSGHYTLEASLDGYAPVRKDFFLGEEGKSFQFALQRGGVVRGRLMEANHPAATANIALLPVEEESGPFNLTLDLFRSHGVFPTTIPANHKKQTDQKGNFVLQNIAPGKYLLLAQSERSLPFVVEAREVLPGNTCSFGEIALPPGFALTLKVRNPEGKVVTGAEVQWNREAKGSLVNLRLEQGLPTATTDQEGSVTLRGLPAEHIGLTVTHPDYANHSESYDFSGRQPPAEDLLEITLGRGASVAGLVVDGRSGYPLADVSLELEDSTKRVGFSNLLNDTQWQATSDEEGSFLFSRVPAGEYILIAKHDDFSETQYGPFQVGATAVEDLMVMLHPGATLHVEVLDNESVPIAEAKVQVVNAKSKIIESAITDANGVATLPPLKAGDYQITFTNTSGFDREDNTGSLDVQLKFVHLEEGEELTITLGGWVARANLEGEVRRGGELLSHASVAIITPSGVKAGVADDNGWYHIEDVPLGIYTVVITAGTTLRGGSTSYESLELQEEGTIRHDFALPESGIEVTVTSAEDDKALANIPVAIRPLAATNIQGGDFGLTNNEGVLQIQSLAPGKYILSVGNLSAAFLATSDVGLGSKQISPIVIQEAAGIQHFAVELEKGATFRVRVRDSVGNLVSGAHLHYLDADGQPMNILSMKGTNSKGVAQLEGLPAGPGIILVRHPFLGIAEIPVQLEAGMLQKKEVTLEAGTRVYVTPTDETGAPLAGVFATALDHRGAPASYLWAMEETQATNAAFFSGGEQKLGPLLPGDYFIQLYRPGSPPVRHAVSLHGEEEIHLQLPYSSGPR